MGLGQGYLKIKVILQSWVI